MEHAPHILVIRSGAIGDTILMSVVFQALRRHLPQAYIAAIGVVERLQLINTPGLLDQIASIDMPGVSELFIPNTVLPAHLNAYFQRFDTILFYSTDPERIATRNLCKFCAQGVHRFDPFLPDDARQHITEYLLSTLRCLGIAATGFIPEIALPAQTVPFPVLSSDRLRVAIHGGSGRPQKNWAARHFSELCQRLHQTFAAQVLVIAGPAEEEAARLIADHLPGQAVQVLRDLTLASVAAALRTCQLYIGNDSGLSHLAAALGIPTVVIFGPSDPKVWRPIGKDVHVLHAGNRPYCEDMTVAQVWQTVRSILEAD
jgi:ADP-heptose:LPS heptosyltransferase